MASKEDFLAWKQQDVTKAVFDSIVERINEGVMELSLSAGVNQLDDRFKTGMIRAFREILDIQFDDTEV